MIGLAIGMTWIYAGVDNDFGSRANAYVLTHQLRLGDPRPVLQQNQNDDFVTIYRSGSVNTKGKIVDGQLQIDENATVRTSLWWMLWDTKFLAQN